MAAERFELLDIDRLLPASEQPRKRFAQETLEDLAASIQENGLIQPVVVRPLPGSRPPAFEIVAGERRWRAAQLAGLHRIPALIRDVDDDSAALAALVENLQREDLSLLEEARAVQALVERHGLTHEAVAQRCGYRTRDRVTHLLRILRLPSEVLDLIDEGKLSFGHAKLLAGLPRREQAEWARETVKRGWSVEALSRHLRRRSDPPARDQKTEADPNVRRLETLLGEHLGAPVRLDCPNARGGRLVIEFDSLDVLDGILDRIGFRDD